MRLPRRRARLRAPKSLVFIVTSELTALTFLRGSLRHLQTQGFEVTVIASSSGKLESFAVTEGVKALAVPIARAPAPVQDLRSLLKLWGALRRLRPEVVVAATPKASLLGLLAARMTAVPVRVYQLWGLRSETMHGWRKVLFEGMERAAMRSATHIVANSPSLADEAQRLSPAKQISVVGEGSSHGVDLTRFSRTAAYEDVSEALPSKPGSIVVGSIGRVHADKGIATLLAAARIAARTVPLTLVIVGPSEDERLEKEMQRSSEGLDLVRVGAVRDPRPWFDVMDIHVLPTLREGFPNVVLEASAMQVPTITTMATGARDSVIDGETGMIVPVADKAALADAIVHLARAPELRERMAQNARAHVERVFDSRIVLGLQTEMLERVRARVRHAPEKD